MSFISSSSLPRQNQVLYSQAKLKTSSLSLTKQSKPWRLGHRIDNQGRGRRHQWLTFLLPFPFLASPSSVYTNYWFIWTFLTFFDEPVDLFAEIPIDKMHGSTSYREKREREALGFSNPNTMVAQDVNFRFLMQIRFKQ